MQDMVLRCCQNIAMLLLEHTENNPKDDDEFVSFEFDEDEGEISNRKSNKMSREDEVAHNNKKAKVARSESIDDTAQGENNEIMLADLNKHGSYSVDKVGEGHGTGLALEEAESSRNERVVLEMLKTESCRSWRASQAGSSWLRGVEFVAPRCASPGC
ncbi:hypothetical protein E2562_000213 [Oryza meyeriana var. granulata]|uniref:Uncharacterized protein n=1 Tax=Oryza meyeriana var. granulata TaxID=110450 RepID=A0A6G1CME4_9ORYZ|nr:hypothetical protein E2562_000213 [Oryza meyeriana var. granulata]